MFVFDLDGTLMDSFPALKAALAEVLASQDIPLPQDRSLRLALSDGLEAMFVQGRPAHMEESAWAALRADCFSCYHDRHLRDTPLFPGVRAALQQLHAQGAVMAVCTNRDRDSTLRLLQLHDLQPFFSQVVALEDMTRRKPAPDGLLQLRDQAGLASIQPLIFIGDSEVDAQTALNAQVRFCAHLNGYHRDPRDFSHSVLSFDDYEIWTAWALQTLQASLSPCVHHVVSA